MATPPRSEFSRLGFMLAAAGSAVGLGNIWHFPSQVTQHGGAAFVLVYVVLTLLVAYPALVAELLIGRYTRSNPIGAFSKVAKAKKLVGMGFVGLLCASLILSFYSIIGGWIIAYGLEPIVARLGFPQGATWLVQPSMARDVLLTTIFSSLTILIITAGVQQGIEYWSKLLMPMLLVLLVGLILYVFTLEGALIGLKYYLVPDCSCLLDTKIWVSAMGQAFFSTSLGTGTMLVYGSYINKQHHLSKLGFWVVLVDFVVAFLAGLLILPAMYAAAAKGIDILDANGKLIAGRGLVFQVLPALFHTMGPLGACLGVLFFLLLTIAALTSSISMLEVPVAYVLDAQMTTRKKASWLVGGGVWLLSLLLISNFAVLFDFAVEVATRYTQPLLGLVYCIFAGWLLDRQQVLEALQQGTPAVTQPLFYKVWSILVRFITPLLIVAVWVYLVMGG